MSNPILNEDLEYTFKSLAPEEIEKLRNSTILITGCGGFLGQFHLSFWEKYGKELNIKKVIGIDSFLLGESSLIKKLKSNPLFDIRNMDVIDFPKSDICKIYSIDYVLHMASIASPTYYRKHPLETVDSNIWGIRALLDGLRDVKLKGFLFYSSSEVYGDPDNSVVPTSEEYWGNVSCLGPRACYDESKRFGETLCWIYNKLYQMPIRIVRLFNVYGPGLKLNDRRAPADFAMSVMHNKKIDILSDGSHTRTFCYVADSCVGEYKTMLYDSFDVFNIGCNSGEMCIEAFAALFQKTAVTKFGYAEEYVFSVSDDPDYLVNDPKRRCPDLTKSEKLLNHHSTILPKEGVARYLEYLKIEGENAIW